MVEYLFCGGVQKIRLWEILEQFRSIHSTQQPSMKVFVMNPVVLRHVEDLLQATPYIKIGSMSRPTNYGAVDATPAHTR